MLLCEDDGILEGFLGFILEDELGLGLVEDDVDERFIWINLMI